MFFCAKGHVITPPGFGIGGTFKPLVCWACVAGK